MREAFDIFHQIEKGVISIKNLKLYRTHSDNKKIFFYQLEKQLTVKFDLSFVKTSKSGIEKCIFNLICLKQFMSLFLGC